MSLIRLSKIEGCSSDPSKDGDARQSHVDETALSMPPPKLDAGPCVRSRGRRAGAMPLGFALISAIALVVVLAMLGTVMVSLSSTQQVGSAREFLGSRAYFAARVGVERGLYRIRSSGECVASTNLPALVNSAAGFTVNYGCTAYGPYDEGGVSVTIYQVTGTATIGTFGGHDYAERVVQAVVSVP